MKLWHLAQIRLDIRYNVTSYGGVAKLPIKDAGLLKYIYLFFIYLQLRYTVLNNNENKTSKENLAHQA